MAKNTYKKTEETFVPKKEKGTPREYKLSAEGKLGLGLFLILIGLFLLIAFASYFFTGQADQSHLNFDAENIPQSGKEIKNALGIAGARVADLFIFRWFGIAAFLLIPILLFSGIKLAFNKSLVDINKHTWEMLFFMLWVSCFLGYFVHLFEAEQSMSNLSGGIGFAISVYLQSLIGWPAILLILLVLALFLIFFYKITSFGMLAEKLGRQHEDEIDTQNYQRNPENWEEEFVPKTKPLVEVTKPKITDLGETNIFEKEEEITQYKPQITTTIAPKLSLEIEQPIEIEPDTPTNNPYEPTEADDLVKAHGLYDSTLDLPKYQFPIWDLLKDYPADKAQVTNEELEANSKKIVETLGNYGIGIASIKATIGPTVTLYEIIPEAGVRISKIKSLEDDIALSLAALGIRIIAPIPGKGTIGIEVPNKNREMVSIKSLITSEKFQKSTMDLPIVLGKTISNEIFIADLAKMPHLLMAGATGQGKSVGLNVIIASLIYKKHPSQLKFVLVDPKKVELTLFNKLERHFLAMLPGEAEPIITNTKKVVNTLNSLCIEMDNRYNLLKDAGCRNLKEYNLKFVNRKLNPEKGHKYMPYIVLVIDELADLMMTAGKEVEQPIARLAQLARAVGLHLIVATQRPSVNVITGIIKANFPARLSFKVTSKIDSRTILDTGGAEQLVGQGDMLLSTGSDILRLQCAFVDTPEVDDVCDFIGAQQGYDSAYMLPEFEGDESGNDEKSDFDPSNRDAYFDEAARLVVNHQQGSTSLIQRRLKLGYNRAGRLIDQLEAAGIVGPFEGSKAREVLIQDSQALEEYLKNLSS